MSDLQAYRDEYQQVGIGPLLEKLLQRIIVATVRQYPALEYSKDGTWSNAACEDLLNDWVLARLVARGDLGIMLGSAATIGVFRAACTTSLRQFIANGRRRSIAGNFYKRVQYLLSHDQGFVRLSESDCGIDQLWTTVGGGTAPCTLSNRQLLKIANELTDADLAVVHYGPFSHKLSPILREPKLRSFLVHVMTRSNGALSLRRLLEVIALRFGFVTEENVELDPAVPSNDPNAFEDAAVIDCARGVLVRLNAEEAAGVREYFRANAEFSRAAEAAGADVSVLKETVRRVFAMICECSDSIEEATAVMRTFESMLLEQGV
jgi:hypothetical protein